jgi:glycine cleavage system regulatory protein
VEFRPWRAYFVSFEENSRRGVALAALAKEPNVKSSLVITFAGPDRPGLVDALSHVVVAHGGNWERSRMARLAGRFAGILEVVVEPGRVGPLTEALGRITGLSVSVAEGESGAAPPGERVLRLELTGQDREGIVREVASALAQRGVNIEDLSTEAQSAPMSGERLFRASAELRCPPGLEVATLRADLERLSNELLVDLELAEGER